MKVYVLLQITETGLGDDWNPITNVVGVTSSKKFAEEHYADNPEENDYEEHELEEE